MIIYEGVTIFVIITVTKIQVDLVCNIYSDKDCICYYEEELL